MATVILDIPRRDAPEREREQFLETLRGATADQVVLTTLFWPPGHLEGGWFDWLAEVVEIAAATPGRMLTLAELTWELYDDILEERPAALVGAVSAFIDQVFVMAGPRAGEINKREIHDLLNRRGPELIAKKMHELGLVVPAHLALRNGWHCDREIKFGSFGSVAGGDGFTRYLAARLARRLAVQRPGLVVFWSDPVRHETFPRLMEQVHTHLERAGQFARVMQLIGTADEPALPARVELPDDRPTALAADVLASSGQARAVYDLLHRNHIYPDIIAPLVQFSFTPSLKFEDRLRVIEPAVVEAQHWESTDDCTLDGPPKPTETESRVPPEASDPDRYQLSKGSFWSMMCLAGTVGRDPGRDTRHLHQTYLEVSRDRFHVDALLRGVFDQLRDAKFVLVHHDNPVCEAIHLRIKAHCTNAPVMTYVARRVAGEWRLGKLERAANAGLGAVVVDDGATTGLSLMHVCDTLREQGVPVLGIIVVEDKLDPAMRRVITSLASSGAWGSETRLFFLHRSPSVVPTFIEGACLRCEELAILGAIDADRRHRPAFAERALRNLRSDLVWDAQVNGSKVAPPMVETGHEYPLADQYNRLLATHRELANNVIMMDIAIRDALPGMRAQRLAESLGGLDERWLERAILWLEPEDMAAVPLSVSRVPTLGVSRILRDVAGAMRRDVFAGALSRLVAAVDGNPAVAQDRYQDMVAQVVRALARRPNRVWWIEAGVEATRAATCPALIALREDLLHLAGQVSFVAGASSATLQYSTADGVVAVDRPVVVDDLLRAGYWVLDLRQPPYLLRRHGAEDVSVPLIDAVCWSLANFTGRQFTGDLTRFLKRAGLQHDQESGGSIQNRVDSVRRRTEHVSPRVVRPDKQQRDTPGERKEFCLLRGTEPGVIIWRDDGSPLWSSLSDVARKRQQTTASS